MSAILSPLNDRILKRFSKEDFIYVILQILSRLSYASKEFHLIYNNLLFTGILPEALDNSCQRCTEKQKFIALRTIQRLRNEYPTLWREMVDFWDPSEERIRKFEQSLTKNTTDDSQNVVLFDRFSEDASQNDVAASVKPPTTGMTYLPALPPSTTTPRSTTTTRTTPRSTTTRRVSSSSSGATTEPPKVVFRPLYQEPQVFDLPSIKIRLFNDFTNVIKAGTQVAGMVFQALAGGRQNQN